MTERRKTPTLAQRLTPCICCGQIALTQQHHPLPFAEYGEGNTVQICGACHDILHVARNAYTKPTPRNNSLWMNFVALAGPDDCRVRYIMEHLVQVRELEQELWRQNLEADTSDFTLDE